jgi:uncharacterized OB-fold protein
MSKDERGRAPRRGEPYLDEPEAKPFWAACREHKLTAQRCSSCKRIFGFPPQALCPHCLATKHEWVALSGKGTAYQNRIPYNVSLVDLQEGGRLVSNVIGCAPEEVKIGMPVEVVFEDFAEYTLPKFKPVK